MKAKMIWIAEHPQDSTCVDVEVEDPRGCGVHLDPYVDDLAEEYVPYKKYVCIEIED